MLSYVIIMLLHSLTSHKETTLYSLQ